jgi:NitT/TauT family transport system permease protein
VSSYPGLKTDDGGVPSEAGIVAQSDSSVLGSSTKSWTRREILLYRLKRAAFSPRPYLMLVGFALLFGFWWLSVDVLRLPRFEFMPGFVEVLQEWTSRNPDFGVSLFTEEYYLDIWASVQRVFIAFAAALAAGIPVGLLMGWSIRFREYTFPVFETFRPIPILAWVPLAILMFSSEEGPVIFLTFLPAFFATALNTLLGVRSVDRDLVRAAYCLGSKPADVFRHVVVPGALPYIFTGLQIAMGVAWFSLVAGEMIAGRFGLGYLINSAYSTTRYPTIIIGMMTLGFLGWLSSILIRVVGNRLMQYRARVLAQT